MNEGGVWAEMSIQGATVYHMAYLIFKSLGLFYSQCHGTSAPYHMNCLRKQKLSPLSETCLIGKTNVIIFLILRFLIPGYHPFCFSLFFAASILKTIQKPEHMADEEHSIPCTCSFRSPVIWEMPQSFMP